MTLEMEPLVRRAQEGDREALEALVRGIQDRVYGLAIRMLGYPADAEDATQEILVKVITRLSSFQHQSDFFTWVFRVAANHLLTTRKRRAERMELTFEQCESHVEMGIAEAWNGSSSGPEQELIVQEIRITCMQGLLLCLDRPHRLAYVLGEIFEVDGRRGAAILDITPAAFRKRLSRARKRVRSFMATNCGLVHSENPCHCHRVIPFAARSKWIDPDNLVFAQHPCRGSEPGSRSDPLREMSDLRRIAALFRDHPDYAAPVALLDNLRAVIHSDGG